MKVNFGTPQPGREDLPAYYVFRHEYTTQPGPDYKENSGRTYGALDYIIADVEAFMRGAAWEDLPKRPLDDPRYRGG